MCYVNIFVLICLVSFISVGLTNEIEVKTTHGRISGKILKTLLEKKTYYGFMGVPYAEAPVKGLRFLPPQPIEPWSNTLPATKETPACVQYNIDIKKGQPYGQFGAEDCLYLDIYTPALDQNKRPTIVFLHNINFRTSNNKTKDYGPDFFIEEDTIIVTISYRLSVFGFLSMEDEVVSGNAGLKDIVQGLEWYKNNAVNFGGDPDKITLLGSQGGAVAVDLLIHSKAKNLFSSAILQSGTSWHPGYLQENVRERAVILGKLLEVPSNKTQVLLENFLNIPVDRFLENVQNAIPDDYFRDHQRNTITFGPVVEKDKEGLITEYPEHCTGKIEMPIMIGYNSAEGLDKSIEFLEEPRHLWQLNKDIPLVMPRRVSYEFDPKYKTYFDAVGEIKTYFFPNGSIKVSNLPEYIKYIGEVHTSYAVDYTVQYYANKTTNNLYYYYFDYYSDLNENTNNILKLTKVEEGNWGAAATGDELCYLFMCPNLKQRYKQLYNTPNEAIILQRNLVKMWSNFAKYGNPNINNTIINDQKWPTYQTKTKQYLHIQKELSVRENLEENSINFWDNWIKKWEHFSKSDQNKHDEL